MRPPPIGVPAAAGPTVPVASMVAVAAGTIAALYLGSDVFVPLALAILISFALAPLANRLKRLGLAKAPAVLVVVALALGLVSGFFYLLVDQAVGLARDLPRYEHNLRERIRLLGPETARGSMFEQTAELLRRMSKELDKVAAAEGEGAARPSALPATPRPIPVEVHEPPASPLATMLSLAGILAEPLATIGIMLLFIVFVLLERENLRDRFIRLFGARDVHRATEAINDAGSRIGRYLLMQLTINLAYGGLFGAALWLIGVPNPLLWGLIGVVLRFIPYIGAPVSLLFPLALTLAAGTGWTMPLLTVAAFAVIEVVCTYVLEPFLFGSSTGLSKVALIVATAFWTVLWGPVGLLLAAPLTACLVVIGRYVPQLEFLEVLLGNRQVLAPEVKVYQRLLAGDPDEAADVAEDHAAERGFFPACDEVLLPVLALIAEDRARGVLGHERLRAMATDVVELAQDLAAEHGPGGAASAGKPRVLSLGAGSRVDEAAAHVAAHGLRGAGLPTMVHGGAGERLRASDLPGEAVDLVLVSAVGPTGVGRAKRLLRRLRERYGVEMPVVVGLWRIGEGAAARRERLDAEEVATSLDEAMKRIAGRLGDVKPATPEVAPAAPLMPSAGEAPQQLPA
jgi:predicted PurR-regulated permease PerM